MVPLPERPTSPRRLDAAMRRNRALQLKLAGATYKQIAETPRDAAGGDMRPMYSSRQRAQEAVSAALKELREETAGRADEMRTLELARLESMQVALWPSTRAVKPVHQECENCGHTVVMYREPSPDAVDRVIKIMQQRTKYLPLALEKGQGVDHAEAKNMITDIMDALAGGVAPYEGPDKGLAGDLEPDEPAANGSTDA